MVSAARAETGEWTRKRPWGCLVRPVDELLSDMMARNASDLHIKAGSPPVMRVDGELALMDEPPLTPEDTKDVAAGAVVIACITAVIVGLIIFLPHILILI